MKQERKVAHGLCEKSLLTESVRNHRFSVFTFLSNNLFESLYKYFFK